MKRKPVVELITVSEPEIAEGAERGARGDREDRGPIAEAARVLHAGDILQLRVEPADVAKPVAIERASAAFDAVRRVMVERNGLPEENDGEVDRESYGTPVAPFRQRRFLLPHQDGGHCSFLTPSRMDCPDIHPDERVFSNTVYWKRPSHKLFQGFIITDPGEPLG